MEPLEILGLAQKNVFGDMVGDYQSAQRNTLGNQQAQMQNLQMMLGLQNQAKLREMAPQIADQIRQSEAPFAGSYASLVEADPTQSGNVLGQLMGYEKSTLKYQLAQDPQLQALIQDVQDEYQLIDGIQSELLRGGLKPEEVQKRLKDYSQAMQEIQKVKQIASLRLGNASQVDQILPKVKSPIEFALQTEDQELQRATMQMTKELHPYKLANTQADTALKRSQVDQIAQDIESGLQGDLNAFRTNNGQAIKDASESITALNKLRSIKAIADSGNLAAKQAIVFLNARAVTGPGVLTDQDVANTSGADLVQILAQKFNLNQYGSASNYASLFPSTEKLFKSEIQSKRSQLEDAVKLFNDSRVNAKDKISVDQLLPKEQALQSIGTGKPQQRQNQPTQPKARTGKVSM